MFSKGSLCTITACCLLAACKVVEWDNILIIINLVCAKWPYFQDMKTISHAVNVVCHGGHFTPKLHSDLNF